MFLILMERLFLIRGGSKVLITGNLTARRGSLLTGQAMYLWLIRETTGFKCSVAAVTTSGSGGSREAERANFNIRWESRRVRLAFMWWIRIIPVCRFLINKA